MGWLSQQAGPLRTSKFMKPVYITCLNEWVKCAVPEVSSCEIDFSTPLVVSAWSVLLGPEKNRPCLWGDREIRWFACTVEPTTGTYFIKKHPAVLRFRKSPCQVLLCPHESYGLLYTWLYSGSFVERFDK
eukprot:scaffold448_cov156-Amphora_coffeaeformis.AAC.17